MPRKLTVVSSKKPSPLVQAVEDYVAARRAQGLSPKTLKYAMRFPLREIFLPWCADNDITSPAQLDTKTLTRFQAHLMDVGGKNGQLKRSSVHSYAKSVKGFIAWLKADGENVTGEIKLPRLERRIVQTLTTKEVDQLEAAAQTERDKLIVRVLAETGIRRAECAGLKARDLLEESGRHYLLVHGKGSRDRKVPVAPSVARRLRKLINGRPKDSHVFLALHRQDGTYEPLSDSGITQMVTALGEKAELDKHVTPHLFRHTAATYMLRRGVDSLLVAQVLGHSSLQMIQRVYSHMTPTDAHVALMKALSATDDDDE
jgi:integrase